jgi:hypothetical protein
MLLVCRFSDEAHRGGKMRKQVNKGGTKMNDIRISGKGITNRPGFALLLVFILTIGLAAIIMVLYTGAGNPFSAWEGTEKDRFSDPNARPWEEGHYIWGGMLEGYGMSGRRPPFRAQPKLTREWSYQIQLLDGDRQMGTLNLLVMKNFDATSFWKGEFDIEGKHYTAELWSDERLNRTLNSFSGNIYPLKIFEGPRGRDRSKLYVITAGPYELRGPQPQDTLSGSAYVNAWVSKDLSAQGTLSIPNFIQGRDLILNWGPVYPK